MLTQELVRELFDYVPETGELIRKVSTAPNAQKGDIVGCLNGNGYLITTIRKRRIFNHQLVFIGHYGHLPKFIDHIDQNPLNNRIENLREATNIENSRNKTKYKSNTSGYKGVSWSKNRERWCSQIKINTTAINLGRYTDPIEAAQAYNLAAEQYFGEFAYFNGLPDELAWGVFE